MFEYVKDRCDYLKFNDGKNNIFKIIFSTRKGGVSLPPYNSLNLGLHVGDQKENVIKNRDILSETVGINSKLAVIAEQVHDSRIAVVEGINSECGYFSNSESLSGYDGMITKEKNVPLFAFFADCVPIILCDYNKHIAGIAHAGWKGTIKKIAAKIVKRTVEEFSSKLEDIKIIIGPSISAENYEIDKELADLFSQKFDGSNDFIIKSGNSYFLDLKKVNKKILLDTGIKNENIIIENNYCTFEDEDLFYSYRRDGNKTGRMAAVIEII
ncbi:MAG: peptidoglycan editing factor PgeF [Bacillota bacterium]